MEQAAAVPRPAPTVRVIGQPLATDSYGPELQARFGCVPGIELDFRHVPDGEVAATSRAASCLVLPYERVLTSGAAMLGLSLGLPTVAPDTPRMRELLSGVAHDLLYAREEPGSLLRAVERAVALAARRCARRSCAGPATSGRSGSAESWAGSTTRSWKAERDRR